MFAVFVGRPHSPEHSLEDWLNTKYEQGYRLVHTNAVVENMNTPGSFEGKTEPVVKAFAVMQLDGDVAKAQSTPDGIEKKKRPAPRTTAGIL